MDSIETHAYGIGKDLLSETEEIKCNNITKQYKMIHLKYMHMERAKI